MKRLKYDITTARRHVQIAIDKLSDCYINEQCHEYSELASYDKMLEILQDDLAQIKNCHIMDVYLIYIRLSTIYEHIQICIEQAPIDNLVLLELGKAIKCLDVWIIGDMCITLNKEK